MKDIDEAFAELEDAKEAARSAHKAKWAAATKAIIDTWERELTKASLLDAKTIVDAGIANGARIYEAHH